MGAALTRTAGATGNVLAATAIAASGTTSVTLDLTAVAFAVVRVDWLTGSAVTANAGLLVTVKPEAGSSPLADSTGYSVGTVPNTAASTTYTHEFTLAQGLYNIALANQDATNGGTATVTTDTYN